MKTLIKAAMFSAALGGLGHGSALAQVAPGRTPYDAQGLTWGAFTVLPRMMTTVDFNDNVYASPAKTSDKILQFMPEVAIKSDWSRHALEGDARVTVNRHETQGSENTTDSMLHGFGRLDIGDASNIHADVQYKSLTEPRYSTYATQALREPVRYRNGELSVGGIWTFNRLRLVGDVSVSDYRYDNNVDSTGSFVLEQIQDRTEWTESGRLEYGYSVDTALFLAASLNQRSYRLRPPISYFDRDSNGLIVAVGTRLSLTHLLRGEFQVGYLNQNYASSVFRSVSGLSVDGQVSFFVTPLTTVVLKANRSVGDAADPRSSGYVTTNGSVEVDHELLRNIILMAQTSYATDHYQGIDRNDGRRSFQIGGSYLLNRSMSIGLHYNHIGVTSSGVDRLNVYQVNRVLLTLVLQR
jgi:hypothetical protein